jgi:hypothetical protein
MIQKILDTVTIIFPALIAILSVLNLTGVIPYFEAAEQVILIILGVASSIASIWWNHLSRASRN